MDIPPGMDVENPIEDNAFMAWISAKRIDKEANDKETGIEYELKNVVTGTRFTFKWDKTETEFWWTLQREDE